MNDCAVVHSVYDKVVLGLQSDCKTVSLRLAIVSVLSHSAQVKFADRNNRYRAYETCDFTWLSMQGSRFDRMTEALLL